MQSIDVYKVAIWKKKFLLVITIIDDVISGPEVVQKSVPGYFLKQYYLRCHHARKKSIRKTWTIFHFFWLLSAALVYWIWKIILKWDNQEHREESLKALYICIFGKLFNIKEKLRVELRFLRKSMNQKTLPEGIFPAYIINFFPSNVFTMRLFQFYAAKWVLFQCQRKKNDSSHEQLSYLDTSV